MVTYSAAAAGAQTLLRLGEGRVGEVAFQAFKVAADVEAVHEGVMRLDGDGHHEAAAVGAVLAEGDFRDRLLARASPRVGDAGEGGPGEDGVVYEVIPLGTPSELNPFGPGALNRLPGACVEDLKVVVVVEEGEGEVFVVNEDGRPGVYAVVDEYAVAAQPVTERLDLVGRLHRAEVIGDEERYVLVRARPFKQRPDIDTGADIEERVVIVLEELELLTAAPVFNV